jgi:hypothetical protein
VPADAPSLAVLACAFSCSLAVPILNDGNPSGKYLDNKNTVWGKTNAGEEGKAGYRAAGGSEYKHIQAYSATSARRLQEPSTVHPSGSLFYNAVILESRSFLWDALYPPPGDACF